MSSVRHEQQFVGEYYPQPGASRQASTKDYISIVESDYGVAPRVVEVRIPPGTSESSVQEFSTRIAASPTFTPPAPPTSAAKLRMEHSIAAAGASSKSRTSAAAAAAAVESSAAWAPKFVSGMAYAQNGYAKFYSFMNWTGAHNTHAMPFDWGYEYDWSLYNFNRTGTRGVPLKDCAYNNDKFFWAARYPNEIRSWSMWVNGTGLNGSDDYGAYLDANDLFDSCSRLGFAVGIGWPLNMPEHPAVEVLITADRGTQSSTRYEVQLQASSNDCIRVPDSNCMGLNTARAFPGPGKGAYSAVPISKGWTVPSCFAYTSNVSLTKLCPVL